MRKLLKWIEAALAAAAFAEEGEVETARQIVAEAGRDVVPPGGAKAAGGSARRRSSRRQDKVARLP